MALCGSLSGCGCSIIATQATIGGINGDFPSIVIDGGGQQGDAWNVRLLDEWTAAAIRRFAPTPWFTPPLLNGWVAIAGQTPQFRRVGDMTQIRGAVGVNPLTNPSGDPLAIFILPPALTPATRQVILSMAVVGSVLAGTVGVLGLDSVLNPVNFPIGGLFQTEPPVNTAYTSFSLNMEFSVAP